MVVFSKRGRGVLRKTRKPAFAQAINGGTWPQRLTPRLIESHNNSNPTSIIFKVMMSWLQENYEVALSNPIILSVLIILGAVIAAKITDMIFTRIFKRIVNKTQTNFDDRILQLLHRPIFYSILFSLQICSIFPPEETAIKLQSKDFA